MRNAIDSWLLYTAVIIMMMSCCYSDHWVTDLENCQPFAVNQTKALCLSGARNSSSTNLSLACPDSFKVLILSAWVYRSQPGGMDNCSRPTHNPNNTQCFELTAGIYRCLDSQCNLTIPAGDLCNDDAKESTIENKRYAYVVYRCQPQFSQHKNVSTISTVSEDIVSDSLVAVKGHAWTNLVSGLYAHQKWPNCSAIILKNSSAIISIYFLQVKYDPGRQRSDFNDTPPCIYLEITKGPEYIPNTTPITTITMSTRLCSVCLREVLEYSPIERYVRISYQKDNVFYRGSATSYVSIDFTVHLQVFNSSKVTVQCGSPPYPLVLPTSSSSPSSLPWSTKNTSTDRLLMTTLIVILSRTIGQ